MSRDASDPGSDASWLECEAAIDRFEIAWQEQGEPQIAAFLPPAGPRRARLLRELITIDLEYRWSRGRPAHIEDYAHLFPELATPQLPADLIAEEVYVRRQVGQAPSADELRRRFPDRAAELEALGLWIPAAALTGGAGQETIWDEPCVDEAAVSSPRHFGRYELRGRVGRGAFADVYRAWDPALHREVALKVAREDARGDPDLYARLLREARSTARLRHPAIVPIHETGEADGRAFIAYEFIPGPTLATLVRTARPGPEQAAEWIAHLADALDYAHRAGVVHRDIKPSNIMLDRDGRPVVTDFGLARLADAGGTLTGQGDVLGTPCYMAPEQAAGRGHEVDGRADVYSLGAVLYELLTARRPFEGPVTTIVQHVLRDEPPRPSRLQTGIPAALETICQKAMAKEPGRRYATAAALAEDLRCYLARRPIRARRVGPIGWLALWCRRNPAPAAITAVAAAIILAVAGVAFRQVMVERDRYRAERDRAEANLHRALLGEVQAQMKARDTGWWWQAVQRLRTAASVAPHADRAGFRDLAAACLATEYPCLRQQAVCRVPTGPVATVAVHPHWPLAVSGSTDGSVCLWAIPAAHLLGMLSQHTSPVTAVAFHPAGGRLAAAFADGTVEFWEVSRPPQARPLPRPAGTRGIHAVTALAFSADGAWLALACHDGSIRLLALSASGDPIGMGPERVLAGHTGPVRCLAFAPVGRSLASGAEDRTVRCWDVPTGRQTFSQAVNNVPTTLAFTPDGQALAMADRESFGVSWKPLPAGPLSSHDHLHSASVQQLAIDRHGRLLTVSADGTVRLWRRHWASHVWEERAVADAGAGPVLSLALAKQGQVLTGHADGRVRVWELAEPRSRALLWPWSQSAVFVGAGRRLVTGNRVYDLETWPPAAPRVYPPAPAVAVVAHPDRRRLACALTDGTVEVWDMAAGSRRWRNNAGPVTSVASRPDGRSLAGGTCDGRVRLWDWDSGRPGGVLDSGVGPIHSLAWSRDGQLLAVVGTQGLAVWDQQHAPRLLDTRARPAAGAVAFGDNRLAADGPDGAVEIWDVRTWQRQYVLSGHTAPVAALAYGPDGRLASATGDTVRLWTAAGRADDVICLLGLDATWLAFDPRGHGLIIGRRGGSALAWDLDHRGVSARVGRPRQAPTGGAFAPDGSMLWLIERGPSMIESVGGADLERARTAGLRRRDAPELIPSASCIPTGHADTVWGVAATPDGRWIATAGHDRLVKVWDGNTLALVHTLEGSTDVVWCVALSPDGRWVASGGDDHLVRLWDRASGRLLYCLTGHQGMITSVAFDPLGRWLVSTSADGAVRLWERSTGREIWHAQTPSETIHMAAFRPDGNWLAVACEDHRLLLWDLARGLPAAGASPRRILSAPGALWSVAWSIDGGTLAAGGERGRVVLWDGDTFARLVMLQTGQGQIRGLAFSRDGQLLAGAAYVAPTVVWDLHALRQGLGDMGLDW